MRSGGGGLSSGFSSPDCCLRSKLRGEGGPFPLRAATTTKGRPSQPGTDGEQRGDVEGPTGSFVLQVLEAKAICLTAIQ